MRRLGCPRVGLAATRRGPRAAGLSSALRAASLSSALPRRAAILSTALPRRAASLSSALPQQRLRGDVPRPRAAGLSTLPQRLRDGDVLRCVDAHCGGEPATVVLGGGGFDRARGASVLEKRADVMANLDHWREVLLHEPRGFPCANADYLVEPTLPGADAGFVIAEQAKIYPLMSGHNTICVATVLVECGLLPEDRRKSFVLEAPSGAVPVTADVADDGKCRSVTFDGPASFVGARDAVVRLDEDRARALGIPDNVRLDVASSGRAECSRLGDDPSPRNIRVVAAASPRPVSVECPRCLPLPRRYGGMWYAIVDAADLGLDLTPDEGARIRAAGELIKEAAQQQCPVEHPLVDYPGPDILAFRGPGGDGARPSDDRPSPDRRRRRF